MSGLPKTRKFAGIQDFALKLGKSRANENEWVTLLFPVFPGTRTGNVSVREKQC